MENPCKSSKTIREEKYTLTEYAKIKRLSIPIVKNLLIYLTTETDVVRDVLISLILYNMIDYKTINMTITLRCSDCGFECDFISKSVKFVIAVFEKYVYEKN